MMIRMKHPQHGFHMALGIEVPEMKKHGWTEDAPEVAAAPVIVAQPDPAPVAEENATRDALIARAQELGVKVDNRWSDARLSTEIEKAAAEHEEE